MQIIIVTKTRITILMIIQSGGNSLPAGGQIHAQIIRMNTKIQMKNFRIISPISTPLTFSQFQTVTVPETYISGAKQITSESLSQAKPHKIPLRKIHTSGSFCF
jgi:hypothetical protein